MLCRGLDRADQQFAADALYLLTNAEDPGVEVDITPAQTEGFTAAHATQDGGGQRSRAAKP